MRAIGGRSVRTDTTIPRLSPREAQAFVARWEGVSAFKARGLCRKSLDEKLRELAGLMASARAFGWQRRTVKETAAVRARWNRLRRALGG
jgi:hypothetical protein